MHFSVNTFGIVVTCMNFMTITFIVMFCSVSIIYKITNFFGFRLKFKSLLLCALCAFGVNFITLSISAYLTAAHFVLILFAVLLSACFVTYYNECLNRRGGALTEKGPGVLAAAEENRAGSQLGITTKTTRHEAAVTAAAEKQPARESVEEKRPLQPAAALAAPVTAKIAAAKFPEKAPLAKTFQLPARLTETIAEIVRKDMENDRLLKLTAALSKLNSLDAILDYAYEQKARHNYSNALFAFKQALHKYETDAYAPFIIIEMGNIYKDSGLYDEAISTYSAALSSAAVADDGSIREKFQATISYLHIVKSVLIKHNSQKLPFNQIPRPYMREIEFTFQNWSEKKYVS